MAERPLNPSVHADGRAPGRVAIVVSRYNASITDRLLEGARAEYARRGGDPARLSVYEAPGSFEVPPIVMAAARSEKFTGIVALSCIIRGETRHDRYLAQALTAALLNIATQTGVPVGLGVLTVENAAQARARAGGKHGNKGADAMAAVLDAADAVAAAASGAAGIEHISVRQDKAAGTARRGA